MYNEEEIHNLFPSLQLHVYELMDSVNHAPLSRFEFKVMRCLVKGKVVPVLN